MSSFCPNLIFTDLSGAQHRAYSVKVERNFYLCVLVKLGAVLLVKMNVIF